MIFHSISVYENAGTGAVRGTHAGLVAFGQGSDALDGCYSCLGRNIDVFLGCEAAEAEARRLEGGLVRQAHGHEHVRRLDRSGAAGAAGGHGHRVHVGHDRLGVSVLEAEVGRVGQPPAVAIGA